MGLGARPTGSALPVSHVRSLPATPVSYISVCIKMFKRRKRMRTIKDDEFYTIYIPELDIRALFCVSCVFSMAFFPSSGRETWTRARADY